jgi:hypothetical protein
MTKQKLIQTIDNAIRIGKEKLSFAQQPNPYNQALQFLQKMRLIVATDQAPDLKQAESTSLGIYAAKEVESFDTDYASVLSQVTYAYDKYYNFLDSDLEDFLKSY